MWIRRRPFRERVKTALKILAVLWATLVSVTVFGIAVSTARGDTPPIEDLALLWLIFIPTTIFIGVISVAWGS